MNARYADKAFWLDLLPQLSISSDVAPGGDISFSDTELDRISDKFWKQGYLCLPALLDMAEISSLERAMRALSGAEIPPVYIYLFDQPWQIFARLNQLVAHFLGGGYALLPNFWAWHLDRPGKSGWPVHRDCSAPTVVDAGGENILISLSLWISLTPSDARNGCMHVITRDRQDRYDRDPILLDNIDPADDTVLAVPAGSVLGWPQDLYHWGGVYTAQAESPRSSLSFEFQNRAFDPLAEPLLDVSNPPDFKTRLDLINAQFEKYRHIVADSELGQPQE